MKLILTCLLLAPVSSAAEFTQILDYSEYYNEALRFRQVSESTYRYELCEMAPSLDLEVLELTCKPLSRPLTLQDHANLIQHLLHRTQKPASRANISKFGTNNLLNFGLGSFILASKGLGEPLKQMFRDGILLLNRSHITPFTLTVVAVVGAAFFFRLVEDRGESNRAIYNALREQRWKKPQSIDANHRSWPLFKRLLKSALLKSGLKFRPEELRHNRLNKNRCYEDELNQSFECLN